MATEFHPKAMNFTKKQTPKGKQRVLPTPTPLKYEKTRKLYPIMRKFVKTDVVYFTYIKYASNIYFELYHQFNDDSYTVRTVYNG